MKDAWGRTIEYVCRCQMRVISVVPIADLQKLRLKVKHNYYLLMNG